jgi:hypothetical protein
MTIKRIIQEFIKAFLIGILVFLVIGLINYFNGARYEFNARLLQIFIQSQVYAVFLYMVNMALVYTLIKRLGKQLFTFKNLLLAAAGGVILTMITILVLNTYYYIRTEGMSLTEAIVSQNMNDYSSSLLISIIITGIFYFFYYHKFKQEGKVKEQKIIANTASASFDALKNQLDPHFLFNSLNVLTSLIEENPAQAQKFTTSLSKVYRYVLEQKNKELVTVDEELQFAKVYMALLKMRFEDSIVFKAPDKASNPEAKVVPLSLQLLLENAVKHNMVTSSKKLHITIYEENGRLVVQNKVQLKQVIKKSSGVGLQNIVQRYMLLTDRKVHINETAEVFEVSIPMLSKQISIMKTQESYLEDKRYENAKIRVKRIKEFYIHFAIYLLLVPFFIFLNFRTTGFPWAIFPILGWGLGVLGHASEAFNYNPILGRNWEDKKIRELMEKDNF